MSTPSTPVSALSTDDLVNDLCSAVLDRLIEADYWPERPTTATLQAEVHLAAFLHNLLIDLNPD